MVEKLAFPTLPHPNPYKLQWINDDEGMIVNQQVEVMFSIGNFEDSVLCDIIPMEACHISCWESLGFLKEKPYTMVILMR